MIPETNHNPLWYRLTITAIIILGGKKMKRCIIRARKYGIIRRYSTQSNYSQKQYARRSRNVIRNIRINSKSQQQTNTVLITNRKDYSLSVPSGHNLTVLELVEKYIATKINVREPTRAGYNTVVNLLKKEPFGNERIDNVRISDAKLWFIKLQR